MDHGLPDKSGLLALIMPAITLALFQMTLIMRLVRAEMLEVLRADFIKFARARGLPERLINFRHALKNTMVPVITITGLQLAPSSPSPSSPRPCSSGPAFAVHPGHQHGGHSRHGGYLVLIAFMFVVINLIVDLLYFAVDPGLRVQSK